MQLFPGQGSLPKAHALSSPICSFTVRCGCPGGCSAFSVYAAGERPVDGPFLRAAQAPIDEAFDSVTSRDNKRSFLGYRELRGDTTRRFKTVTDKQGKTGFYTIIGAKTGMMQNGEGPTVMLRWVGTLEEPFKGGNFLQTGDGEGASRDWISMKTPYFPGAATSPTMAWLLMGWSAIAIGVLLVSMSISSAEKAFPRERYCRVTLA